MAGRFDAARDVLERASRSHAFPGAALEIGIATRPLARYALGSLTFDPDSERVGNDTIFDLASLTKVLSTTMLVMRQVENGRLALEDRVAQYVARWTSPDRTSVTIRDLLSHASGLPAHRPYFERLTAHADYEAAICAEPLEYEPGSKSIYSDLGFMLLGFILERAAPLPDLFDALRLQMGGIQDLQFLPPSQWRRRVAPTEVDWWRGRLLRGEVHDENAFALGGAAGHAGLFGTVGAVGECARQVLQILDGRTGIVSESTLRMFVARREDVPSSRALGWDTMRQTSSCGTRMSPTAFGHTGFTGTSLWIDPVRGVYVTLLTNRVHPSRSNPAIRQVRRDVHDAVFQAVDAAGPTLTI